MPRMRAAKIQSTVFVFHVIAKASDPIDLFILFGEGQNFQTTYVGTGPVEPATALSQYRYTRKRDHPPG